MKKLFFLVVILAILIGVGVARADDLETQIALKETQFQSLQWEFRYIQERINTLQALGQQIQKEIEALKKAKEEKKVEPKK